MRYSSDKPISKASEDRYSRKEYSKKLAKLLCSKNITDDFVVGLYSKWGYGKSSTLAMVKEYIGSKAIVIPFNPWIFDNQTAIVTALLYQLAKELDENGPKKKNIIERTKGRFTRSGALDSSDSVQKLIKDYTSLVGVGLSLATGNSVVNAGMRAVSELAQKYIKTSSIVDIKLRIEKKIACTGKRVIIIIDDIDRLDKDEIFQLLKLVKIIADFKGVTYLLAFDDEAVVNAINDKYSSGRGEESGRAFLEKIIQVPLHLPLIPPSHLSQELLSGIDEILQENKIRIDDDDARVFRSVYDSSIAPLIDSPRTITRYLNSLKFTVPFIIDEVDPIDLLIIEALRLFYPSIYNNLRTEKQLLTGVDDSFSFEDDNARRDRIKTKVDALCQNKTGAIEIVNALFPVVNKAYNMRSQTPSMLELRRKKSVASPDYYDRYFSYGLGADDVSDTELIEIISQSSAKAIANKLSPLLINKSQDLILEKTKLYYSKSQSPIELAKAMFLVVNDLSEGQPGIFRDSPLEKSIQIVTDIVKDSPDRIGYIKELLDEDINPEQLFYLAREVILNSEGDSPDRFLSHNDFTSFKKYLVKKIISDAKKHQLHSRHSRAGHILYHYWAEYGSKKEVDKYLRGSIKNADDALDYITLHLGRWHGSGGSHRGNFDRATYDYIGQTIDIAYLYDLVAKAYPELKDVERYTELGGVGRGGINKIGNENSPEFRKSLAEQVMYLHEHPIPKTDA